MSLGSIISADRGSVPLLSIVGDLEKAVRKRGPDIRDRGWHPSQLMDMCPRFEVLRRLLPDEHAPDRLSDFDLRTQMIFDVGTALHLWWQEQYFGPMGVLKGSWRCCRCGYRTGIMTMPMGDHLCGSSYSDGSPMLIPNGRTASFGNNRLWKFAEVPVKNSDWGIVGHSDGIYILGLNTAYQEDVVLDIKTAGPNFWSSGGRPYPSNIFQINLYMWMLNKKKGVLLYVDKGGCDKTLPMMCKEIIVDYNDIHRRDACAKIDAYREAVASKTLPPRMAVCELRPGSAKARGCYLNSVCLSDRRSDEVEKIWGNVEMI